MTSVSVKKLLKYELDDDFTLPQDLAKVPVLYMYGTEKRAAFHVNASVKILEREHKENKSKSNAIAVDGAGHYLYIQKPDLCFDCVTSFMQKDKVKWTVNTTRKRMHIFNFIVHVNYFKWQYEKCNIPYRNELYGYV